MLGGVLAIVSILYREGLRRNSINILYYWLAVVLIRSAGNAAGRLVNTTRLHLPLSTLVSGLVFIGVLMFWKEGNNQDWERMTVLVGDLSETL